MTDHKIPLAVQAALIPKPHWKVQSFEYCAAHSLVGSDLIQSKYIWTHEISRGGNGETIYYHVIGFEHGRSGEDNATPSVKLTELFNPKE